jgi:hypothetical protein
MINKLIYIILGALLVSCGSSESLKDEAYNAGWNSIWDERCRGITKPQVVPEKYDDSYEGGTVMVSLVRFQTKIYANQLGKNHEKNGPAFNLNSRLLLYILSRELISKDQDVQLTCKPVLNSANLNIVKIYLVPSFELTFLEHCGTCLLSWKNLKLLMILFMNS